MLPLHIWKYISRVYRSAEGKTIQQALQAHVKDHLHRPYIKMTGCGSLRQHWLRLLSAQPDPPPTNTTTTPCNGLCSHHQIPEILRWTSIKIPAIQIVLSPPTDLYKLTMECLRWAPGCSHEHVWAEPKERGGWGWEGLSSCLNPTSPVHKRDSWWWNHDLIFSKSILGSYLDA